MACYFFFFFFLIKIIKSLHNHVNMKKEKENIEVTVVKTIYSTERKIKWLNGTINSCNVSAFRKRMIAQRSRRDI